MSVLAQVFSLAFVADALHVAIPLALAAIGGAVTERAGVVDLALEGKLLFGAFTAAAVGYATGSLYAGCVAGMIAGAAVAGLQMWLALSLAADQVIVGIGINLLAAGGTRYLMQLFYREGTNTPDLHDAFGSAVFTRPTFWIAVAAAIAVPLALRHTRWGLRLRAAGDRPESLVAVGVSPGWTRVAAGMVGGALAGAGGADLSLGVGGFVADHSAGRGYIALAMIILVGWRPALAAIACIGLGASYALADRLQMTTSGVVRDLLPVLPHILTIAVLVIVGGKSTRTPRSLGKL